MLFDGVGVGVLPLYFHFPGHKMGFHQKVGEVYKLIRGVAPSAGVLSPCA